MEYYHIIIPLMMSGSMDIIQKLQISHKKTLRIYQFLHNVLG